MWKDDICFLRFEISLGAGADSMRTLAFRFSLSRQDASHEQPRALATWPAGEVRVGSDFNLVSKDGLHFVGLTMLEKDHEAELSAPPLGQSDH